MAVVFLSTNVQEIRFYSKHIGKKQKFAESTLCLSLEQNSSKFTN